MARHIWLRSLGIATLLGTLLLPASAIEPPVELVPSDGAGNHSFGAACAIDGDTLVVGAPGAGAGAAYVFVRSGGAWVEQAKLVDSVAGTGVGLSVDIDGDTIVLGASVDATNGAQSGAALVFVRNGTVWTQQQKLFPDDPQSFASFGRTVAVDGGTVVVGTPAYDLSAFNEGAAHVFVRTGTTWAEQQRLTAGDPEQEDLFGRTVAISGDSILVGAQASDDAGSGSGSAYVFTRTGTTWSEQAKLLAGDAEAGDIFGSALALEGDVALIGALADDDSSFEASGAVYWFQRTGTTWAHRQKIFSSALQEFERFGWSLDLFGDRALIGANGWDGHGTSTGAASLFSFDGNAWIFEQMLTAPDPAARDEFGRAVALDRETAVVGASGDDDRGTNSGAAWTHELAPLAEGPRSGMHITRVNLVLPPLTSTAFAKKAKTPGLYVEGILDTGPDEVNLTRAGTLDVGSASFDMPALVRAANGRTYAYEDGALSLVIEAPKTGGSKCTFDLRIEADLSQELSPDGSLDLRFSSVDVEASGTVRLEGGKFKLDNSPDALGTDVLLCSKAKAKLKGDGRDTFRFTTRFGGDGSVPNAAPDVTIGFGDDFESVLGAEGWKRKKNKWLYKGPKTGGVAKVTFDFGRGLVKVSGKKVSLGAIPQGLVPLGVRVALGDDRREVQVRAFVKGKTLKY